MPITVRETTIKQDGASTIVELHVSDAPLAEPLASFRLTIAASVPDFQAPTLAHLQRAVIEKAQEALRDIETALYQELHAEGYPNQPRKRQ